MDTPRHNTLDMWAVYQQPRDYPDSYVARRYIIAPGATMATVDMFIADSLAELHALLPPGLHRIERDVNDDPRILETWV